MLCIHNQIISEKHTSRLIDTKIASEFSLSCSFAKTNISIVLFHLLTLKFIISLFQKGLMNLPRYPAAMANQGEECGGWAGD